MSKSILHPETSCVHAGMTDNLSKSLVPPIFQTSAFRFDSTAQGASLFAGEKEGFIYTRMGNPTIKALENAVSILEGGSHALGCSSGMAAINTVFSSLLSKGDHVICSAVAYGPTTTLLNGVYKKFGVETSFVDTTDLEKVNKAIRPATKMIYVETPGNPTVGISDIQRISKLAHANNAVMVVDNTFMSPYFQTPLRLGADIVVHSLTKFLNGHADVIGGIIVVDSNEQYSCLRKILNQTGGVIDPFNAFLVHRGLKTLSVRMEKHAKNGLKIAEFLENHPKIAWVRYPGLKSHPQYNLGLFQHTGFGGVMAFELKKGFFAGETLLNNVKLCTLAVSLGGVETLIQHPASMTHASMTPEQRLGANVTDGLIRLSVGIESATDLIADLNQALDHVG